MAENKAGTRNYTLDKDAVDNLKMEASAISIQHETAYYRPLVTKTISFMLGKYGKFIDSGKRHQVEGLEGRMFVVNEQAFKTFYEEWNVDYDKNGRRVKNPEAPRLETDIGAFTLGTGGLMVFKEPSPIWDIAHPSYKQTMRSLTQDEESAKQLLGSIVMANYIAHETIHNLHQDGLPEAFKEFGVRHYTNEFIIAEGLHDMDMALQGESKSVPTFAYLYLSGKFGDNVPKWFFGQQVEPEVRRDMWITSEILSKEYKLPFERHFVK